MGIDFRFSSLAPELVSYARWGAVCALSESISGFFREGNRAKVIGCDMKKSLDAEQMHSGAVGKNKSCFKLVLRRFITFIMLLLWVTNAIMAECAF